MHCPRCGQQQVSEETRFCSRCGFPLGLVSEILAHGGILPQLLDLRDKKKKFWTRRNGIKIGAAWFLVLAVLITPIAGAAGLEEDALVIAAFGFITGLLTAIFSWMFLESEPKTSAAVAAESAYQSAGYLSGNAAQQNVLPPQQSQPVQDFVPPQGGSWKAPDTSEFAVPHSVTDSTTRLLQKDE
ncbi:MAG: zinc ribbon domain-containing protein [Acidobacteriota bacterium]|nr:zinc ribbon domain-containing protein [Acidobacteriota bacterium]